MRTPCFHISIPSCLLLLCCFGFHSLDARAEVDFARDIQPIFAKHCVTCHGPDEAESGLRLTDQKTVFGESESGERAVVPHDVNASELLRRISTDDESERMPPKEKPLSDAQIAMIRQWIKEGAPWKQHWGFVSPQKHDIPTVANSAWVRNEIDAFILSGLERKKLTPAPSADAAKLMRRAYYDLTGLPPTPEQVQTYLKNQDPNRFAHLVNELLDSQHFGERWGRHWLDLVRFAETNSYERDGPKPEAWRYRDYVIESLNKDKPYDRFIIEQLAGDELPDANYESIVATGYYRLGLWDDEPVDRKVAVYDGLDDIVSTTAQVFLGITLNCARCHDHKIDPIPQDNYYGMLAFFHNVIPYSNAPQNILRDVFRNADSQQAHEQAVKQLEQQRNEMQLKISQLEQQFLAAYRAQSSDATLVDIDDLKFAFYRDSWEKLPNFDDIKAETRGKVPSGRFDISLATREHFFGFVFEGMLKVPQKGEFEFEVDSDDGVRLILNQKKVLEYDGIHGLGAVKRVRVPLDAGRVPIRLEYFQAHGGQGLKVAWSGPGVIKRPLSATGDQTIQIADVIGKDGEKLLSQQKQDEYVKLRREFEQLKKRRITSERVLCVKEHGRHAPETFILTRGSPHAPAAQVSPKFPDVFASDPPTIPEMPNAAKSTGRRTVLAHWIASQDNMQTSRVMVNRIWQHLFGRGIVRSASNFGMLGTPPTQPELLDWLAIRFVDEGWSIKSIIRFIMASNSYQMSALSNDDALAVDPSNNLFWRQNMRRLSAEEIRDSILFVNGRLNRKMYGPSIYPVIPKEVLAGQSRPGAGWGKSSPEDQARRSIYIYVKRSLKVPIIESFDFAETDLSCPVRFVTTQPTQALGLLNSDFSNEQAKVFAKSLKSKTKNVHQQVAEALWLVTQREPTNTEIERGVKLIKELQEKDGADADFALKTYCLMALNLNEFVYLD